MIEVSREEFVKRYIATLNEDGSWDKSSDSVKDVIIEGCGKEYDNIQEIIKKLNMVLLDREGWQRIKTLIKNFPSETKKYLDSRLPDVEMVNFEFDGEVKEWLEELMKEIEEKGKSSL